MVMSIRKEKMWCCWWVDGGVVEMELEAREVVFASPQQPRRGTAGRRSPQPHSKLDAPSPWRAICTGEVRGGCYRWWLTPHIALEIFYGVVVILQSEGH